MKFINRPAGDSDSPMQEEDPLSGIAQLFDISIAFIVAVIAALFTLMSSFQLFAKDSDWTITRKTKSGAIEMIEKHNDEIIKRKVTPTKLSGNGERLGTAYKLENGQIIYVPDGENKEDKKSK